MVKYTTRPGSRESSSRAVQLLTSIYLSFSLEFIVSSDQRFSFNFDLTVFLQFEITKITTFWIERNIALSHDYRQIKYLHSLLWWGFGFSSSRFRSLPFHLLAAIILKFYTFSETIFTTPTDAIPLLLFRLSITIVIIGRTRRLSSLSLLVRLIRV